MGKIRKHSAQLADDLLHWYDRHARDLPWRVGPASRAAGEAPDPYRVWLSEIMLQQTTVATVTPRFEGFLSRWPTVKDLAAAKEDDVFGAWAGLGYYARARNLHACAKVVADELSGVFPSTEEALLTLPGIGPYTAAAIAAIAFDQRAIVVDGNIERVGARLWTIDVPIKKASDNLRAQLDCVWPVERSSDFAQSLMDLGATVCTPRNPSCLTCPIREYCCAAKEGTPERYPVKAPKKAKPLRQGRAYALFNKSGEILLEKRPAKGLLGGMYGLPGSDWQETGSETPDERAGAPIGLDDWTHAGEVTHVFTHFKLALDVFVAQAPRGFRRSTAQKWVDPAEAEAPTVMRKAIDLAVRQWGE